MGEVLVEEVEEVAIINKSSPPRRFDGTAAPPRAELS
jgi:hypothetical protein